MCCSFIAETWRKIILIKALIIRTYNRFDIPTFYKRPQCFNRFSFCCSLYFCIDASQCSNALIQTSSCASPSKTSHCGKKTSSVFSLLLDVSYQAFLITGVKIPHDFGWPSLFSFSCFSNHS